ncbi:MAG: biopolymer transporter ExbD [Pirellulales bacterium]|nr:biopolymer transporter ExbD [Pirellulales bacterium]
MRLPQRNDRGRLDVTMTPMIDVVFLLLVFFIWTSSFQAPEDSLPATLSMQGSNMEVEDVEPRDDAEEPIVIKVLAAVGGPSWSVRDTLFQSRDELESFLQTLSAVDNQLPVILDIDGEAGIGEAVKVYDLSRRAGFSRIQFAASVPVRQ